MQAIDTGVYADEIEESPVTFQIALVGCDGLVIGSDRLGQYAASIAGKPQIPQNVRTHKYFRNDIQSVICFAAGAATAIDLGRRISQDCGPLNLKHTPESEWYNALYQVAATPPHLPPNSPLQQSDDEIIVVRADTPDAFWLVLRRPNLLPIPTILRIQEYICTGVKTAAQFLPQHLWTKDRTISELRKLALLALSYAAREQPQSVGPPFDIMTLDKTGRVVWSVHNPMHERFQQGLDRLFSECDIHPGKVGDPT